MRLNLTAGLDGRDGSGEKDALLTNVLKEEDEGGEMAVARPGLSVAATSTGNAGGLVCFNGELITIFSTELGHVEAGTGGVVATEHTVDPLVGSGMDGLGTVCLLSDGNLLLGGKYYDDIEAITAAYLAVFDTGTNSIVDESASLGPLWEETVFSVASNSTRTVAVTGTVYIGNADGSNWTGPTTAPIHSCTAVGYADGYWVACGLGTVAWSTDDGDTWQNETLTEDAALYLNAIPGMYLYTGSYWYLYSSWADSFTVYSRGWKTQDFVTFTEIVSNRLVGGVETTHVAYAGGYFYLLQNGALWVSSNSEDYTVHPTLGSVLRVFSSQGIVFAVDSSKDLYRVTPTGASLYFTETRATGIINDGVVTEDPLVSFFARGGDNSLLELSETVAEAVITPLDAVATGIYDFTQSPL